MFAILSAIVLRHDLLPVEQKVWNALVVAFAVAAAISDVRWRKIPRWATVAAALAGLVFHAVFGGLQSSALAMLIAFAIGLLFFQLKAIGGGDVKLIAALGALLGLERWLFAMEIAVLVAAIIGVAQALRRGMLRQMLHNIASVVTWVLGRGAVAHPTVNVTNPAGLRAPFGVAAALGTVCAVWKP